MLSHVVRRNANVCGTATPQSPIQTTMALQTLLYHTPNWKSHRLDGVGGRYNPTKCSTLPHSSFLYPAATAAPRCRTKAKANGVLARIKNSMRAPDPSTRPSDPFSPFSPRESTPDPRNRNTASGPDPRASGREVKRAGRMAQTPQAGTGDSVGRFRRYHFSTVINYDSYFLVGDFFCFQLLFTT